MSTMDGTRDFQAMVLITAGVLVSTFSLAVDVRVQTDFRRELEYICKLSSFNLSGASSTRLDSERSVAYSDLKNIALSAAAFGIETKLVRLDSTNLQDFHCPAIAKTKSDEVMIIEKRTTDFLKVRILPYAPYLLTHAEFHNEEIGELLTFPKMHVRSEDGGELVVSSARISLGTLTNKSAVVHEVTLQNIGNKDLILININSSCRCTAAIVGADRVLPGQQTKIAINLRTENRRGPIRSTIALQTDDPLVPEALLTISGYSATGIDVHPKEVVCGRIPRGVLILRRVRIGAHVQTPITITNITCSSRGMKAALEHNLPEAQLTISLNTKLMSPGEFREDVVLTTTAKQLATIRIPIRGEVVTNLRSQPEIGYFGIVTNRQALARLITISWMDGDKLTCDDLHIQSDDKRFSVNCQEQAGDSVSLMIGWWDGYAINGTIRANIGVNSRKHPNEVLRIPIYVDVQISGTNNEGGEEHE